LRAGHLPRAVRRAVRQGPRLHADRGQGRAARGVRHLAGRAEGRGRGPGRALAGARSGRRQRTARARPRHDRRRAAGRGARRPAGARTGRCPRRRRRRRLTASERLTAPMSTHTATADHHDAHGHKQSFVERWLFSTNHKDIGTLYLLFSFTMFIIGAAMSVVIRTELAVPGLQHVSPHFFNQMTSMHALVMIFGGVMPAFVGLANWMIPLPIGAPDMALPRMNNWSFWILPFAFTLLLMTLFLPGGGPAGGWTMYPPLSLQGGNNVAFSIFAIHMMGISSI